jgi:hypothetical protein
MQMRMDGVSIHDFAKFKKILQVKTKIFRSSTRKENLGLLNMDFQYTLQNILKPI